MSAAHSYPEASWPCSLCENLPEWARTFNSGWAKPAASFFAIHGGIAGSSFLNPRASSAKPLHAYSKFTQPSQPAQQNMQYELARCSSLHSVSVSPPPTRSEALPELRRAVPPPAHLPLPLFIRHPSLPRRRRPTLYERVEVHHCLPLPGLVTRWSQSVDLCIHRQRQRG